MEEQTKCECRLNCVDSNLKSICDCYCHQTTNRIREEWREELAEIIFQIQRCPKQYRTCLNCKEALENHIAELLKLQKESLVEKGNELKKILEENKEQPYFNKFTAYGAYELAIKDYQNLIKEDKNI